MTERRLAKLRLLCAAAAIQLAAGCAAPAVTQPPPAQPAANSVYIGQPCAPLRDESAQGAPAGIFLEVARIGTPLAPPLEQTLAAGPVAANPLVALLLDADKPVTGPWSFCSDSACSKPRDGTLTIQVVKQPATREEPVALALTASPEGGVSEQASVRAFDQRPVIAALPSAAGGGTVVVTPYYMAEPHGHSRSALMSCQRAQR